MNVIAPRLPTYTLQAIPDGKDGTAATLKIMSQLVKNGKKSPLIIELARRIVRGIPPKQWSKEIAAIQQWVKNNIRYTKDIRGVETIQTPEQTLRLRTGDCDDMSILVASLLETIGHPTRFKAIGFQPGSFNHVFPETKIAHKWVSVETTEPVGLGWIPKGVRAQIVRHN